MSSRRRQEGVCLRFAFFIAWSRIVRFTTLRLKIARNESIITESHRESIDTHKDTYVAGISIKPIAHIAIFEYRSYH